ncbi:hypothetical protein GLYMA_13G001450v4 [Glycine max]|nr:hypothetical protein GLYMA_13G001450v4 [Glycine max]KAH1099312.1 hypothetical protein GYH30_034806 [Glycine max]
MFCYFLLYMLTIEGSLAQKGILKSPALLKVIKLSLLLCIYT